MDENQYNYRGEKKNGSQIHSTALSWSRISMELYISQFTNRNHIVLKCCVGTIGPAELGKIGICFQLPNDKYFKIALGYSMPKHWYPILGESKVEHSMRRMCLWSLSSAQLNKENTKKFVSYSALSLKLLLTRILLFDIIGSETFLDSDYIRANIFTNPLYSYYFV